jgi:hypothetical protein
LDPTQDALYQDLHDFAEGLLKAAFDNFTHEPILELETKRVKVRSFGGGWGLG